MSKESVFLELKQALEGRTIRSVELMSPANMRDMSWSDRSGDIGVVLVLDNGTEITPFRDPEGNGPGWLDVLKVDAT